MSEPASRGTREAILDAAEELLRRHGPAKTNVVDVARKLGMSHANVYRHFASKAALQDAVTARWLHHVSAPLAVIADAQGDAAIRLEQWVLALAHAKRRKVLDDAELFATYHAIAEAARDVVDAHMAELAGQVARIIAAGVAADQFRVRDPAAAAGVVLDAMLRFHHPHFVRDHPGEDAQIRQAMALLLAGLRSGVI